MIFTDVKTKERLRFESPSQKVVHPSSAYHDDTEQVIRVCVKKERVIKRDRERERETLIPQTRTKQCGLLRSQKVKGIAPEAGAIIVAYRT